MSCGRWRNAVVSWADGTPATRLRRSVQFVIASKGVSGAPQQGASNCLACASDKRPPSMMR